MILDTDTISYYLRGMQSIKDQFIAHQYELASTAINYAELVYGLKKRDAKRYLSKVELIFDNIKVYGFDKKSAAIFGELKAQMQRNGVVIADMDLLIASIALANKEKLITHNLKHFSKIEMLAVESWVK